MFDKDERSILKDFYQNTSDDLDAAKRNVLLAEYHVKREDFFEAIQLFKKAFRVNPDLFNDYKDKFRQAIVGYRQSLP